MVVLSVLGLTAVASFIGAQHYLASYGGAAGWLSEFASSEELGLTVDIGNLDVDVDFKSQNIEISLYNIAVSQDEQRVTIPRAGLIFGWTSIASLSPSEISIDAAGLDLVRQNGGWKAGSEQGWMAQIIRAQLSPDRKYSQTPDMMLPQWLSQTRDISISGTYLRLHDDSRTEQPALIEFAPFRLSLSRENDKAPQNVTVRATLKQKKDEADIQGLISIQARYDVLSSLTEMSVLLSHADLTEAYELIDLPQMITAQHLDDVSGTFELSLDGSRLVTLEAELDSRNGQVSLPQLEDGPLAFTDLSAAFSYSAEDSLVALSAASIALPNGHRLTLSGQLFGIDLPHWAFKGTVLAEDIAISDLLSGWRQFTSSDLAESFQSHISGGRFQTITMEFAGSIDSYQRMISVNQLNVTGDFVNLRLGYSSDQYQQIVGTVSGKVEADILAGGEIGRLVADVDMQNGFARLKGFDDTVQIAGVSLIMRLTPEQLSISQLEIDLGQHGSLSATVKRLSRLPRPETQLTVSAGWLDAAAFSHFWPEQISPRTRRFIHQRFSGGRLEDVNMRLLFREDNQKPRIIKSEGQFSYANGQFMWRKGLPSIDIENSIVSIDDNQMRITSASSRYDGLSLRQSELSYGPVIGDRSLRRTLNMSISGRGALAPAVRILKHPSINQFRKLGLEGRRPSGEADFKLVSDFSLVFGTPLKLEMIEIDASLRDVNLYNLPLQNNITGGQLELNYRQEETQLSGTALIDGVPAEFTYVQRPDGEFRVNSRLDASERVTSKIAPLIPAELTGEIGGKFSLSGNLKTASMSAQIDADLSRLGIRYDLLDWAKLPREDGRLLLQADILNGRLQSLRDIGITAGTLSATGRILFGQGRAFSEVLLRDVVYPGTELTSVIIERGQESGLGVTAEGAKLDLTPFLASGGNDNQSADIEFDITSDVMNAGSGLVLSGHLTGTKRAKFPPRARLQGQVSTSSDIIIEQTTLDAEFGGAGIRVTGAGLIGGGETEISYETQPSGARVLTLMSENGGRVLDGLSITDAIRGGTLKLETVFDADNERKFETSIQLGDFNVVKGSQALRAYSVLSLAGLYSLIEGEGTNFVKGEAMISSENGRHNFTHIKASGSAIGVSMVGSYNSNTSQVDVSGNLVPISQVSTFIGAVPLLGEILTGIDKSGLLVSQFSIRGDIDEPEISVNPVSLFVPGLIRDLFSPNWLGSESERILGAPAE